MNLWYRIARGHLSYTRPPVSPVPPSRAGIDHTRGHANRRITHASFIRWMRADALGSISFRIHSYAECLFPRLEGMQIEDEYIPPI